MPQTVPSQLVCPVDHINPILLLPRQTPGGEVESCGFVCTVDPTHTGDIVSWPPNSLAVAEAALALAPSPLFPQFTQTSLLQGEGITSFFARFLPRLAPRATPLVSPAAIAVTAAVSVAVSQDEITPCDDRFIAIIPQRIVKTVYPQNIQNNTPLAINPQHCYTYSPAAQGLCKALGMLFITPIMNLANAVAGYTLYAAWAGVNWYVPNGTPGAGTAFAAATANDARTKGQPGNLSGNFYRNDLITSGGSAFFVTSDQLTIVDSYNQVLPSDGPPHGTNQIAGILFPSPQANGLNQPFFTIFPPGQLENVSYFCFTDGLNFNAGTYTYTGGGLGFSGQPDTNDDRPFSVPPLFYNTLDLKTQNAVSVGSALVVIPSGVAFPPVYSFLGGPQPGLGGLKISCKWTPGGPGSPPASMCHWLQAVGCNSLTILKQIKDGGILGDSGAINPNPDTNGFYWCMDCLISFDKQNLIPFSAAFNNPWYEAVPLGFGSKQPAANQTWFIDTPSVKLAATPIKFAFILAIASWWDPVNGVFSATPVPLANGNRVISISTQAYVYQYTAGPSLFGQAVPILNLLNALTPVAVPLAFPQNP